MSDNPFALERQAKEAAKLAPKKPVEIDELKEEGDFTINNMGFVIQIPGCKECECTGYVEIDMYLVEKDGDWNNDPVIVKLNPDIMRLFKLHGIFVWGEEEEKYEDDGCDTVPICVEYKSDMFAIILGEIVSAVNETFLELNMQFELPSCIYINASFGIEVSPLNMDDAQYDSYAGYDYCYCGENLIVDVNEREKIVLKLESSERNDNWCKH